MRFRQVVVVGLSIAFLTSCGNGSLPGALDPYTPYEVDPAMDPRLVEQCAQLDLGEPVYRLMGETTLMPLVGSSIETGFRCSFVPYGGKSAEGEEMYIPHNLTVSLIFFDDSSKGLVEDQPGLNLGDKADWRDKELGKDYELGHVLRVVQDDATIVVASNFPEADELNDRSRSYYEAIAEQVLENLGP